MSTKFRSPRIAIVHDHLGFRGGGERLMLILALALGADFVTAYTHPRTFATYQKRLGSRLKVLSERIVKTRVVRFFWLRNLFWRQRKILRDYDILIASGQTATELVAVHARSGATKIVYTHTPPRRVYDQYEVSKKMYPWFLRPAYALFARYWGWRYQRAIRRFDLNIANAETIRERFQKYIGGDVNAVVRPPVETTKFQWRGQQNYFLSWARIDEAKRVDLVARAFKMAPHLQLKIASGGPWQGKVREIIRDCSNIEMIGWVTDKELQDLVGNCRATIYIPSDEDAGMTHLEANAAGKPVLGVAEGGLRETIIDGETGILISSHPTENDIIIAAEQMTMEWCLQRREKCEKHVEKYDEQIFVKRMKELIDQNNPFTSILGIDASRWEDLRFPGEGIRTGVEVVTKNLIENLVPLAQRKGWRVRIYTPRLIPELPAEIQKIIPHTRKWIRKWLARELRYSPPDYFLTTTVIPKTAPENSFVIVHDILFQTHPELYSWREYLIQKIAIKQNLRKMKKAIAISEITKEDLIRELQVDPGKIIVAPLGHTARAGIDRERQRESFIFYIGRVEKKKSVDILIRAFAKFKKQDQTDLLETQSRGGVQNRELETENWKLVLAGGLGYGASEIRDLIAELGLEEDVLLTGFISEEEKWDFLTRASIFCHPSAHEGSCIPLLEAWDAQTPAIVSNAPTLQEVGEDGALFFRAGDVDDLAVNLGKLALDHDLQSKLIIRGNELLQERTWEKVAWDIGELLLGLEESRNEKVGHFLF